MEEITELTEDYLKEKMYIIRGKKVMLDFELAEIYGYTTKKFNQQVKNNIEKFDENFRFQITTEEFNSILRSKFLTSTNMARGKAREKLFTVCFYRRRCIYVNDSFKRWIGN